MNYLITSIMRSLLTFVLYTSMAVAASGQSPSPPAKEDPLGRSTPQETLVNFLREVQEGNSATAAQYLEFRGRPGNPENKSNRDLAEKLQLLLNRYLEVDIRQISNEPEGSLVDGLPADEERLGTITVGKDTIDVELHRVADKGANIWIFSTATLSGIAGVQTTLPPLRIERYIPSVLMRPLLLDVPAWRWIALLVLVPLAFGIAQLLSYVLLGIGGRLARRLATRVDDRIVEISPGPLRLLVAVTLFHVGMISLALPLLLRNGIRTLELIVALIAVTWFVLRIIDVAFEVARSALVHTHRLATIAVIPLARRILKALAACIAFLLILDNLGFDSKAVLAGLGIGGIALALAAQKTLESVFAGVSLVLDQPVRVGDFCKFGDTMGTVEDIGLRSTRIRTLDQTVLTVPNAQFAGLNIENFAARGKIWFHPTISVRFDTSPDQLKYLLERLRQLIRDDKRIQSGARLNLINARPSFDLEIFAYINTANYDEFVVVQEELLLRILEIVNEAGTSLAAPVQISYVAKDEGLHERRAS
jgi:MscS family membrane protein